MSILKDPITNAFIYAIPSWKKIISLASRMGSCTHSPMLQKDCEFSLDICWQYWMSHLIISPIGSIAKIYNFVTTLTRLLQEVPIQDI